MQILPMQSERQISPEMAAYIASIPVDDEPLSPEMEARLASARAEPEPGLSTEELRIRLAIWGVLDALRDGVGLVPDEILRRAVADSRVPVDTGIEQLTAELTGMVADGDVSEVGGLYRTT